MPTLSVPSLLGLARSSGGQLKCESRLEIALLYFFQVRRRVLVSVLALSRWFGF